MVDESIVTEVKPRGEAGASAELSRRYRDRLVSVAHAILRDRGEAEDVAQEVLMRAPEVRDLEKPGSLSAYLETSARRLAIDRLRRRQALSRANRHAARRERVEDETGLLERGEEWQRLLKELKKLRNPYRAALELRYLDGAGFPEIAARLETSERTARTWVGRGLDQLRKRMEGRT